MSEIAGMLQIIFWLALFAVVLGLLRIIDWLGR